MLKQIKIELFYFLPSLLILPVVHFNSVPGLPGFLSLSYFLLFIITATIIVSKFTHTGFTVKKMNSIDVVFLVFVMIHIIIIPFSVDPRVSIRLVFELVLSMIFYNLISKSDRLSMQWLKGLPIAVFLAVMLALFQFMTDTNWPMEQYMNDTTEMQRMVIGEDVPSKAIGPFLHGNSLAIFLSITLPVVLGFAMYHKKGLSRNLILSVFILGIFAQIASLSRGGMLSLLGALFAMWMFTKQRKTALKNIRQHIRYIVLFAIAVIILGYGFGVTDIIRDRFFSMAYVKRDRASNLTRVVNLTAGIKAVSAHPFVGIGPGTSGKHYIDYDGWTGYGPHNLYLFIASERGIPALAFFLTTIILALRSAAKHFKSRGNWLVGGLFASIVAGMINGLFESLLTDIEMIFFIVNLGILMLFVKKSSDYSRAQRANMVVSVQDKGKCPRHRTGSNALARDNG
jgi:hypothetical protein